MHKTTRSTLRGGNPRVNFLVWLLPLAFLFAGAAAQTVTYTRQNARIVRLQSDPVYASGASPTSVPLKFFIVQRLVNDSDASDVKGEKETIEITVDLLDPTRASDTITAAGKTVSPPQLAALIRQYGLDRANAAGVQ
jgi:hypothetical protein